MQNNRHFPSCFTTVGSFTEKQVSPARSAGPITGGLTFQRKSPFSQAGSCATENDVATIVPSTANPAARRFRTRFTPKRSLNMTAAYPIRSLAAILALLAVSTVGAAAEGPAKERLRVMIE